MNLRGKRERECNKNVATFFNTFCKYTLYICILKVSGITRLDDTAVELETSDHRMKYLLDSRYTEDFRLYPSYYPIVNVLYSTAEMWSAINGLRNHLSVLDNQQKQHDRWLKQRFICLITLEMHML